MTMAWALLVLAAPLSQVHAHAFLQGETVTNISTAVCFNGDGGHAMTAALGQYQALHHLGLMSNVDAIFPTSGVNSTTVGAGSLCNRETPYNCALHRCSDFHALHGPTECGQHSTCVCKEGYCYKGGTCRKSGGYDIDNAGLLSILQRSARRVLWFVNTDKDLSTSPNLCDGSSCNRDVGYNCAYHRCSDFHFLHGPMVCGEHSECLCAEGYCYHPHTCSKSGLGGFFPIGSMSSEVYQLFGYSETEGHVKNQVFSREDLQPLACGLQTLRSAGKPALWRSSLQVIPNTWWGIQGGYTVELLIVYNEPCDSLLSNETQTDCVVRQSEHLFREFLSGHSHDSVLV